MVQLKDDIPLIRRNEEQLDTKRKYDKLETITD